MKPTLHLMVGLPGNGKTTEARRLEKELKLIRLTPDDWRCAIRMTQSPPSSSSPPTWKAGFPCSSRSPMRSWKTMPI